MQPDLIISQRTPTTAALLQQTRTVPIIFVNVVDPIGSGFVASFQRPGGNVTGFILMEPTMASKWLELLKEIAPRVNRVAFLFNPATAPYAEYYLKPFKTAAVSFAVEAIIAPVRDMSELESVVTALGRDPNGGLIVMPDSFLSVHRSEIISLVARFRLPAVYSRRFFTEVGGLLSYGNDFGDNYRRAASYADRILRDAKPSELPVQAPVKFELVINLKTAKALGRADDAAWHRSSSPRLRQRWFATGLAHDHAASTRLSAPRRHRNGVAPARQSPAVVRTAPPRSSWPAWCSRSAGQAGPSPPCALSTSSRPCTAT